MSESADKAQREQFEKWALDSAPYLAKIRSRRETAIGLEWAWSAWQAAFEAGRRDALEEAAKLCEDNGMIRMADRVRKVKPTTNDSILDIAIYLKRDELLTLIDACDIYVFADKLNDIRSQLHRQLPAPPEAGDKHGVGEDGNG